MMASLNLWTARDVWSRLGDARVEATARCRMSARPIEITGVVRSIDPGLRILRAVDDTGHVHTLYVPDDAGPLEDIHAGERIRVTSLVAGRGFPNQPTMNVRSCRLGGPGESGAACATCRAGRPGREMDEDARLRR